MGEIDLTYPVDLDGQQACQLCGGTLQETPSVLLSSFDVSDGVIGGYSLWDEEVEDPDDPLEGPKLHLSVCLEAWLWGLMVKGAEIARASR